MADVEDQGPWFVRVAHNKISVGIFSCTESEMSNLIDEVCDAASCEYRRLPSGGFVFGGEVVLHEWDPETDDKHMQGCWLTEDWAEVYADDGEWRRVAELSPAEGTALQLIE